jgi:hypothetical protein
MEIFKKPNILLIRGVFTRNCIGLENMIKDKYAGQIDDVSYEVSAFDKIPAYFTTVEEWPVGANIHCWTCHGSCSEIGKLISIPKYIEKKEKKIRKKMIGAFDTWQCAARYIEILMDDDDVLKLMLVRFHNELLDKSRKINFRCENPPSCITERGGKYSRDAWKKLNLISDLNFANQFGI